MLTLTIPTTIALFAGFFEDQASFTAGGTQVDGYHSFLGENHLLPRRDKRLFFNGFYYTVAVGHMIEVGFTEKSKVPIDNFGNRIGKTPQAVFDESKASGSSNADKHTCNFVRPLHWSNRRSNAQR